MIHNSTLKNHCMAYTFHQGSHIHCSMAAQGIGRGEEEYTLL
jgi:hypothetical protein